MGIGLLPWERLPAYIFGPLMSVLGIALLIFDAQRTVWGTLMEIGSLLFGAWLVWARYRTGEEPLWSDEQREAWKKRKEGNR